MQTLLPTPTEMNQNLLQFNKVPSAWEALVATGCFPFSHDSGVNPDWSKGGNHLVLARGLVLGYVCDRALAEETKSRSVGKDKIFFFFLGGVTSPQNTWKGGSQVIAGKREVQYQAGGREDKERRKMLSVELLD